jgi:hypothetical protein
LFPYLIFSSLLLVFFFFFLVLLSCPLLVLLPFLFALLIPFILSSLYSPSLFSCSPFYFLFATSFTAFTPLIITFISFPFSHLFSCSLFSLLAAAYFHFITTFTTSLSFFSLSFVNPFKNQVFFNITTWGEY